MRGNSPMVKIWFVVCFNQQTHACACICMVQLWWLSGLLCISTGERMLGHAFAWSETMKNHQK